MRILIWSWKRQGGGLRCGYELARALTEVAGVHVGTFTIEGNSLSDEFSELPFALKWVAHGGSRPTQMLQNLPKLRGNMAQVLGTFRPDCVVSPMECVWHAFASDLVRARSVRYVSILHEPARRTGNGFGGGALGQWLMGRDLARADSILCLSSYVANLVSSRFRGSQSIWTRVHPTFQSTEQLTRRRIQLRSPRLLFFGRTTPSKGLDLLLRSFALVKGVIPGAQLRIAGGGGRLSVEFPLQMAVSIVSGYVPESEIAAHLGWADLVVLPYRNATQSGVAAWATGAGVPCVATPVGALPEQIIDGVNGVVASGISATEIADAVLDALGTEGRYSALQIGAKSMAKELSWRKFSAELVDYLRGG